MWISRHPSRHVRPALRRRALAAFGFASALAFLPEFAGVRAGTVLEPHPGWIAVLVLAARYGCGGFFAGLIASAGAVGVGSAIAGSGLMASWSHLDSGPNLIAFGTCLTVSWLASWHLRRQADLAGQLRAASDRAAEAETTIATLRDVVATLRARVDRTATSLSFLRDVAARLEGTDPVAAAEGAADLALARTGASAAAVKLDIGGSQRLLAVRDTTGPRALAPQARRGAVLTVPIRSGNALVGLMTLGGIPPSMLDDATAHDLAIIASWCGPALANAAWRPGAAAGSALGVK